MSAQPGQVCLTHSVAALWLAMQYAAGTQMKAMSAQLSTIQRRNAVNSSASNEPCHRTKLHCVHILVHSNHSVTGRITDLYGACATG